MKQMILVGALVLAPLPLLSSNAEADMYYAYYSQVNHNDNPWPYIGDGSTPILDSFNYNWLDDSYVSGDQSGMQAESIGGNGNVGAAIWFGVDEDSTFALTRTDYQGYFNFQIWDRETDEILYLENGDTYNLYADGMEMRYYINTATYMDWSFTGSAVPAPSVIALLGLAGVTTRRRRK